MEINGEVVSDIYDYADMDLSEATRKALAHKGYTRATAIQGGAIPFFLQWRDVVAKGPPGPGKTYSFGLPLVEHVDPGSEPSPGPILAPPRALGPQNRD